MFKEAFRIKLKEQGWLDAIKEGGNEYQSWRRIKNNTQTTIDDLILLYEKLPQEKRDEIFNLKNFEGLFNHILTPWEPNNETRLEMANFLIKKSIFLFKREFSFQNKNTVVLNSVISDYLEKAIEICKDIFYISKMDQVPKEIPKDSLKYLCSWSEVTTREKNNLQQFIADKYGIFPFEFNINFNMSNKFEIKGDFNDQGGEEYFFQLKLNLSALNAVLIIYNKKKYKTTEEFIIKQKNDDYPIYYQAKN
ncbi:MAG: hypothetical protein L0H53_04620 [Candidatus Nitrosocosmicus sp.]|nr:hypothetical protein [Candidatus Nitrosocosmicus sp.]